MDIISVVVPVYQVEKYLDRCVESLIHQSYSALEIILVDDGSSDQCPELCEKWSKKDSRIRVIHKKNGGLSDARNAGMKIATGEFISFIDSDDWIDLQFYEKLKKLLDDGAEIAACSVTLTDDEENIVGIQKSSDCELDTVSAMKHLVKEDILRQTVWNKLYRKEIVKDIPFFVGKSNEDDFWSYRVIAKATKVRCCSEALYYYRQRKGSIMNVMYSIKRLDEMEARKLRYIYIYKNFPMIINEEKKSFLFAMLYAYQNSLKIFIPEEKKKCLSIIKGYYLFWKNAPGSFEYNSLLDFIWVKMTEISLDLTAKIRNSLGVGV